MYELPNDFDVQFLSGCYLEMIGFGPSVTKLDFSRLQSAPGVGGYNVSICVEVGLFCQTDGIFRACEISDPITCAPLIGLLLQDVVSVARVGRASLDISFSNGGEIRVDADNSAEFESYSIYLNSGEVIVV